MTDQETPATAEVDKSRWTQVQASQLTSAFHRGGLPGAYEAFPKMDRSAVDAKLDALGLTALSNDEKQEVDEMLHGLKKHRDPKKVFAYVRSQSTALLSELNKPKRDQA